MQTLIELPLLRKIKIIQKLVSSQDGMSEKEIALFNNCSISTARNDVEEISKEYRETFGVNTSNGSLKFSKVSIPETSLVIRALFSESLNIQLLLEIFDHPYQNRRHYCKATAISEASFYRALKSINQVIEAYGFSIKYQEGGYFLQAHSEEELRSFIVSLYTETKTIEECFIRIPFDDLKNLVSQYFLGDDTMNCDVYTSYYSYFAYVSLIRKLQGFTINNKKSSKIYPEYPFLKNNFPDLKEEHLLAIRDRVLQQSKPWKNEEEKKKTLKIFDEFIQEFFTLNTIAYDENLYQQILWVCILTYGVFELFPNKYKIVFNRVDHFTDQFKNSRLQSYQEFHHLFDKTNQALNPSRDYLGDQLLFLIGILSPEFYSNKVQAKVKFYSDLGFEHQKFYKSIFESYFTDVLVLEVESDAAADFIISNYYFENSKKPVLFIKDYPSKQDLLEIHEHMLAKMTLLISPTDPGIKGKLALDA